MCSWDKTLVQFDVNVFNTVDLTWFKLLVKLFSQHWPDVGRIIGAQLLNTRMGGPFIKTGHTHICLMSIHVDATLINVTIFVGSADHIVGSLTKLEFD